MGKVVRVLLPRRIRLEEEDGESDEGFLSGENVLPHVVIYTA